MREVYLKIEGRVQGIGYRRWAVAKALEIGGISGWVRNEDDGSVEILMSGDEEKIDEIEFKNLHIVKQLICKKQNIFFVSINTNHS